MNRREFWYERTQWAVVEIPLVTSSKLGLEYIHIMNYVILHYYMHINIYYYTHNIFIIYDHSYL